MGYSTGDLTCSMKVPVCSARFWKAVVDCKVWSAQGTRSPHKNSGLFSVCVKFFVRPILHRFSHHFAVLPQQIFKKRLGNFASAQDS